MFRLDATTTIGGAALYPPNGGILADPVAFTGVSFRTGTEEFRLMTYEYEETVE